MRFAVNDWGRPSALLAARFLGIALPLTGMLIGCSRASNPTTPDSQGRLLGTWGGTIISEAIGSGVATVVLDTQVGSTAFPLLTGTWGFTFPDPVFTTAGTVSASLDTTGTTLVLFFSRSSVPCPDEPGGVALRVVTANLEFTDKRMHGGYIVAGCPGGIVDLVRK